jgi:hypothetical protein
MAGVVGKNGSRVRGIFRIGRCLRGWIDGQSVFRFVGETPKHIKTAARPRKWWFDEGWFSRNLLDE